MTNLLTAIRRNHTTKPQSTVVVQQTPSWLKNKNCINIGKGNQLTHPTSICLARSPICPRNQTIFISTPKISKIDIVFFFRVATYSPRKKLRKAQSLRTLMQIHLFMLQTNLLILHSSLDNSLLKILRLSFLPQKRRGYIVRKFIKF